MNFKEQLDADLPQFFEPTEFAVTATIEGQPVNGLFDPGSQGEREERSPAFTCADADIRATPYNASVVINGTQYYLQAYRPDGLGTAELILRVDQWPQS